MSPVLQDNPRGLRIGREDPDNHVADSRDEGGTGDGEDPGPDDLTSLAPADGLAAMRGTDAGDGSGYRMRGGNRQAEKGGEENRDGRARFRAEASAGFQAGQAGTHGFDNLPATGHGSQGDGDTGRDD